MQIIANERYYFKSTTPPAMLTNPIAKLKTNILVKNKGKSWT